MAGTPPEALTGSWRTIVAPAGWGHHLRPRGRRRHLDHLEGDLAERHDVVGRGLGLGHAGAVQERAIGGTQVLHLHAAIAQGDLGVAAGDGGIVDGDVARDRPPDDQRAAGLQLDRLVARGAQQLEHRRGIYVSRRLWRGPAPAARLVLWLRIRRTRARARSPPRCPRPLAPRRDRAAPRPTGWRSPCRDSARPSRLSRPPPLTSPPTPPPPPHLSPSPPLSTLPPP